MRQQCADPATENDGHFGRVVRGLTRTDTYAMWRRSMSQGNDLRATLIAVTEPTHNSSLEVRSGISRRAKFYSERHWVFSSHWVVWRINWFRADAFCPTWGERGAQAESPLNTFGSPGFRLALSKFCQNVWLGQLQYICCRTERAERDTPASIVKRTIGTGEASLLTTLSPMRPRGADPVANCVLGNLVNKNQIFKLQVWEGLRPRAATEQTHDTGNSEDPSVTKLPIDPIPANHA
ncbi:hypothetical protein BKA62DRAFT_756049 [Auriculariales sp. MPI-PUGE-AT-0066]|nr:hypothetical protein BKA62DRAFT_756049 [Auriculariales sp. MPI-PUGE-AT-0066]